MDGLARSVGDGIGGLIGGAIGAIGSAVSGIFGALSTALPTGALPVLGIGAAILLLWLVLKR